MKNHAQKLLSILLTLILVGGLNGLWLISVSAAQDGDYAYAVSNGKQPSPGTQAQAGIL